MLFHLDLAGQTWQIELPDDELERFYLPFLQRLIACHRNSGKMRTLIFLAAPAGTGKTTLAAILQTLAAERGLPAIQPLPMDGFHLPNTILDSRTITVDGCEMPLRRIKGAPESYDLAALQDHLQRLADGASMRWPRYDRKLHDPVPDDIDVIPAGICLVEGNYLLLDEPGWNQLARHANLRVFIDIAEEQMRASTVERHIRGGRTPEDAARHFTFTDLRNRYRIYRHRLPWDLLIQVDPQRRLHLQA